uniref:Uncharacterized protein n=1 Tax=Oryza nivara TaxID=4536 RepID=A0A0E0I0L3_ORYNI
MSLHQSRDMPDGSAFGGARNDWQRRYIAEKSRAAPGPSSHGLASAPLRDAKPTLQAHADRGTRYIGSNPLSGWEQVSE